MLPQSGMRVGVSVVVGMLVGATACDLEPDTNYGPHSGLSKTNLPNPPPAEGGAADGGFLCGTPVDGGACSVSYSTQIWTNMQTTWHCSDAMCHGGTSYQPQLDSEGDAYANLMAYMIGSKPYINPCSTDPDASAFLCNIQNPFCGEAQMPFPNNTLGSGPMSPSDVSLVQTWVTCGAPNN